jgi:N12 class adenine-specific DNA methylase/cell pole-organizing protein PopZ
MQQFPGLYLAWDANTAGALTRARSSVEALRTLRLLRDQARQPTDEERATLAQWSGWGPLAPLFEPKSEAWQDIADQVLDMLTPEEAEAGAAATYSAFYTPPTIAQACWQVLCAFGFDGGVVLDPGCGAGVFAAHAPTDTGQPVRMVGVERDPTTAAIASLIHPDMRVISSSFENAAVAECSVDAVVGNVPFGDVSVFDPTAPDEVKDSLHGYFVWRSLRALKPGGMAVLISSRYLLDRARPEQREAIAGEGQFVGAIRLPNDALLSGGTSVVTDIVVLRKPRPDEADDDRGRAQWVEASAVADLGGEFVNRWIQANPGMVLGSMRRHSARGRFGHAIEVVPPDDVPKGAQCAHWVAERVREVGQQLAQRARQDGWVWDADPEPGPDTTGIQLEDAQGRKERSFHLVDGRVCQVRRGALVPVQVKRDLDELRALIGLRDATVALLDAEADHRCPDEELEPLRAKVNALYDAYVARFGYLNRSTVREGKPDEDTGQPTYVRVRPTMGGFRQDPDYVTVLALEVWDDDTGTGALTPILRGRVNRPAQRAERAGTPAEALALCLDAVGRVDLAEIGRLLGVGDPSAVPALLGDLVYQDPSSGQWQTADEYLSGNVRKKLEVARRATTHDPGRYQRNVDALEKVMPADLQPGEIRAKLGQSWIPPEDVAKFLGELLSTGPGNERFARPKVTYVPVTAEWQITHQGAWMSPKATAEWGTEHVDAYRLAELYANGKPPVVYRTVRTPDGEEKRVKDVGATRAAEAKQQELADRFADWVWEDPDRADRLAAEYNRRFNSHVVRRYDGSHLTFPGLADWFTPYQHQRDMVQRMLCTPRALCGYAVGAGKTAIMYMGAMSLRRLGLASKPLIVVPNHLLEQVTREGRQLYPSARILMCGKDDLETAEDRKLFAARCATGDWDAVVITHSAFGRIPVHPRTQAKYLLAKVEEFRRAVTEQDERDGRDRTTKQLYKMIDTMRTRAQTLLHKATDDGVYFEHLGVDYLLVDEAHYFKNLAVPVRTDGFSIKPSKRASDLDMKLRWLAERSNRCATLFTGTPVSNTMLELYVMLSYLAPDLLDELGIGTPDAWAAEYVKFESRVEVAPDGVSFRLKRRPWRFINVPELRQLLALHADIRTADELGLKRPAARYHTVVAPGSPQLRAYIADLSHRVDALAGRRQDKGDDNMLKICSDGRKAALDPGLVGVEGRARKLEAVAERIAAVYHASHGRTVPGLDVPEVDDRFRADVQRIRQEAGVDELLQVVFCDMGTPNKDRGDQAYGKIRDGLARLGVPARAIRFIHDADSDTAKAALFADCRAGKVAVLLGSTDKLGVGTNVQRYLAAMHHVDAPWRPADVEQREGRGLRPGNEFAIVHVWRYVTRGSFDSYMWQTLERKAAFIAQILTGRSTAREVEDIGDGVLSAGEVKALATGNPALLEKAQAEAKAVELRLRHQQHMRTQRRLRQDIDTWQQRAADCRQEAAAWAAIAEVTAGHDGPEAEDHRGEALEGDTLVGYLGGLAQEAIQRGRSWRTVTLRGVRCMFTAASKGFGRKQLQVIMQVAGGHEVVVEMPSSFARPTKHGQIAAELRAHIGGAAERAHEILGRADNFDQRAREAAQVEGKPFPHEAELRAAEQALAEIEERIRATAEEQLANGAAAGAGMPDDQEDDAVEVHSSPWPQVPEHYRNRRVAPRPQPAQPEQPSAAVAPVAAKRARPAVMVRRESPGEPGITYWAAWFPADKEVTVIRDVRAGVSGPHGTYPAASLADATRALAGAGYRILGDWVRDVKGNHACGLERVPQPPAVSIRMPEPYNAPTRPEAQRPTRSRPPRAAASPSPTRRRRSRRPHTGTAGCARIPVARQIRHAAEILGLDHEQVTDANGAPMHRIGGTLMTPMAAADHLLEGGFLAALAGKPPTVRPERLAERRLVPQRAPGSWARLLLVSE